MFIILGFSCYLKDLKTTVIGGIVACVKAINDPISHMKTDVTTLSTPDWSHYQRISYDFQDDRQWFRFKVKACHDAHIYMSDHWVS